MSDIIKDELKLILNYFNKVKYFLKINKKILISSPNTIKLNS